MGAIRDSVCPAAVSGDSKVNDNWFVGVQVGVTVSVGVAVGVSVLIVCGDQVGVQVSVVSADNGAGEGTGVQVAVGCGVCRLAWAAACWSARASRLA